MKRGFLVFLPVLVFLAAILIFASRSWREENARYEEAKRLVTEWTAKLDSAKNPSGVYIRHKGDTLPMVDPWGTPLKVMYTSGGIRENVMVRSAGRDKEFFSKDDIVRMGKGSTNFKGLREGIKEDAEEIAKKKARGVVQGIREGLKEKTEKE